MSHKHYPWVPDGIYDHRLHFVRYKVVDGNTRKVISKQWLTNGGPVGVSADMLAPWGVYPDWPAKPKDVK